ncbi:MAG: ferrous iron transport protein B [Clostridiales Family XIII bacterium]|jgi:ferrous iron transport protein B|nr:ferrous iron transport protein B [Clostridiales Family XIII bacterium]
MGIRIALAGNPNSGKTTLFNALTGANQRVGNWPGVTVEKKDGELKGNKYVSIIDLPGIYSLSPYSPEEIVSRTYLAEERPEAIMNIVDATSLERNLFLTTQLLELGIPVVVLLNMSDVVRKRGEVIDCEQLGKELGCLVLPVSALRGEGLEEATDAAILAAERAERDWDPPLHNFSGVVEHALAHIEEAVLHDLPEERQRWYAVKLFERDTKVAEQLGLSAEQLAHIGVDIARCEAEKKDECDGIITSERYDRIEAIMKNIFKVRNEMRVSMTDKIDSIVTNRFLALPIFGAIMFLVYYVSVSTVGTLVTDWANDGVFGEGWSLFGLVDVPGIPVVVEGWLAAAGSPDWLSGLLIDGIIGGVGAVLGFVPQMLVLFLFLAILEGCGYMARVAFIMDRLFRRFGLSGKSFIPILIGTGCGVPGIMASRTIESEADRRMTIMTTTFIPCSAKLPIIGLIAGALMGNAGWVGFSCYFIGIAAILCSGIILKKMRPFRGVEAPFLIELPEYHRPTAGFVLRSMLERAWSFIRKAGTIILGAAVLVWFLSTFGWADGGFGFVEMDDSILAKIGSGIAWIFAPLGWGNWRFAVAAFAGLIAKENVVGTFGVLYGFAEVSENGDEIWANLAASVSMLAAYSFLVFNLLCAPCFAAMGAIRREMANRKWFWAAIGYQCGLAYVVALCFYRIGMLFKGEFTAYTVLALFLCAGFFYLLLRPARSGAVVATATAAGLAGAVGIAGAAGMSGVAVRPGSAGSAAGSAGSAACDDTPAGEVETLSFGGCAGCTGCSGGKKNHGKKHHGKKHREEGHRKA